MRPVVGQEKLLKILDGYTLQNVPRTILFLGQEGCGKSWLSAYLAEKLDLDMISIHSDITPDKLTEYYQCPIAKLYSINLKEFDEKQQNKILKFIEEPSSNMYIILRAESEVGILPTILNRCIKHTFEDYTPEQLQEFAWAIKCNDSRIYQICKTPGQLNNLPDDNLDSVFTLCGTIVNALANASYANTLSLLTKVNLKDDATKINFDLFFQVLKYVAFDTYVKTNNELGLKIYLYTVKKLASAFSKSIAKESFMLNYLDGLWRLTH